MKYLPCPVGCVWIMQQSIQLSARNIPKTKYACYIWNLKLLTTAKIWGTHLMVGVSHLFNTEVYIYIGYMECLHTCNTRIGYCWNLRNRLPIIVRCMFIPTWWSPFRYVLERNHRFFKFIQNSSFPNIFFSILLKIATSSIRNCSYFRKEEEKVLHVGIWARAIQPLSDGSLLSALGSQSWSTLVDVCGCPRS